MAKYNIPASPRVFTSRYEGFTGCDFNTDPMCVDDKRFPYAQNLVLDTNGYPEKRPGYTEVLSFNDAAHKLFRAVISDEELLLVHAGNKISVLKVSGKEVSTELITELDNVKSCFFVAWRDLVYVYGLYTDEDETGFVQKLEKKEDGFVFSDAIPDAYIPETSIAGNVLTEAEYLKQLELGHVSAGGQTHETLNLFSPGRKNSFRLSTISLVPETFQPSAPGVKFASPLYCPTDFNFAPVGDSVKEFLLGLFLRLYCIDGESKRSSGVNYISHLNYLDVYWSDLYSDPPKDDTPEDGSDNPSEEDNAYTSDASVVAYDTFVAEVLGKDNGTVNDLVKDGVYSEAYAEALQSYAEDFDDVIFSRLLPKTAGTSDDWCFGFKDACGFSLKIKTSSGWEDFPLFLYVNTHTTYGTKFSRRRFVMLYDFGDFDGDYFKFKSALERGFSTVRLLRLGYIPYKSADTPSPYLILPDVSAVTNIQISFSIPNTSLQSNLKKVVSSDFCRMYGVGGASDRVFVKGTGEEGHYVRFSDMDNPLYFPDLNYITCGTPSTEVVDMFPFSSYLCIAKEHNFQDVSFFLVEGTMMEGEAAFLVKEGVPGIGLKTKGAHALCDDVPHFLSDNGVYYLTSVDITAKTSVKNCSYFADSLIRQENPENATLFYYKKNLLLSFPESGHVYVFNTNGKAYTNLAGSDHYVYEVWLWTGVKAVQFLTLQDSLYFITPDGTLMRFKEQGSVTCYSDDYDGEAHAIDAYFKTKAFDDGSFMTLKNMKKRGCGAALKPFTRSSATVYVITDRDERHLKDLFSDIFDWTYLDFVRFEFTANPAIRIMPFNTKVKKYATIQFYVRNNEVGESFGVIGLEKAYTFGNYKKN